MIKVVAYYRVASPNGVERGVQRQKEAVRGYAKKNSFVIAAEVETIESGTTADRDSLRHVKKEVDRTGSEAVLISTIDRIARNPLELKKAIKNFGIVDVKVVEGMKHTKYPEALLSNYYKNKI